MIYFLFDVYLMTSFLYFTIASNLILDRSKHTRDDQEHSKFTPPNIKAMDFNYTNWHESIFITRDHFITNLFAEFSGLPSYVHRQSSNDKQAFMKEIIYLTRSSNYGEFSFIIE